MMMGFDRSKRTAAIRIHDHASSSTPPFRTLKNSIKAALNTQPDYRLFLNEYVKNCFPYHDGIPCGFRDMGIDIGMMVNLQEEKEYDFIYTGSVKANRKITSLVNRFLQPDMAGRRLLILSRDYESMANRYKLNNNIIFKGPVGREELAQYLNRSRFAINYIPDLEPYNQQTSTKFLEYQQFNLPVITTDYPWLRWFEEKYGGHFFRVDTSLKNMNWEELLSFPFRSGDLSAWIWEKKIAESGVVDWLQEKVR
jgi:glycosyltransferase involved in cell wall biosynthesis